VSATRRAKIIDIKQDIYFATTENTHILQRDKLEETLVNLATFLGAKAVKRARVRDGSYKYSVNADSYQSASNTILHLSRRVVGVS
jgi:hypothetical protein